VRVRGRERGRPRGHAGDREGGPAGGVEVRITATLPDVLASRLTVQPMGGLTALSLQPVRLSGGRVVAKFTFDILVSGLLLVLLSPLLLGIAIAVKITSPGPVLYRQRRIGLRGSRSP
jgi:lipopolysaccharide/colanic/teichoic acid biosynthesis glycosyltransferase